MSSTPLDELVGMECEVEFTPDPMHWPFRGGYPLRLIVDAIQMPLIKLREHWNWVDPNSGMWVNTSIIKVIKAIKPARSSVASAAGYSARGSGSTPDEPATRIGVPSPGQRGDQSGLE